eukprot:GHVL01031507.1.p1 GENE.GHVL01031507.1~~GHVL01031507.1.p1  ORF type:complete len:240 (+),score=34.93 GHVL01031507.1:141-860(+)
MSSLERSQQFDIMLTYGDINKKFSILPSIVSIYIDMKVWNYLRCYWSNKNDKMILESFSDDFLLYLISSTGRCKKLKQQFRNYSIQPHSPSKEISLDLGRTFPEVLDFTLESQKTLEIILNMYINFYPGSQYVQGMNFLAGFLVLTTETPEDSLVAFINLMRAAGFHHFFEHFDISLPHVLKVFDKIFRWKDPELRDHLENVGFPVTAVVTKLISSFFVVALPFTSLPILWTFVLVFLL